MTTNEETTAPETPATGPDWTVMDIGAIIVGVSGLAYTFLPWGVLNSRLELLDIALMFTPVFIFVTAVLTYTGTVLVKKTNGTRNKVTAAIARVCVWAGILSLIPIFLRFITVLLAG